MDDFSFLGGNSENGNENFDDGMNDDRNKDMMDDPFGQSMELFEENPFQTNDFLDSNNLPLDFDALPNSTSTEGLNSFLSRSNSNNNINSSLMSPSSTNATIPPSTSLNNLSTIASPQTSTTTTPPYNYQNQQEHAFGNNEPNIKAQNNGAHYQNSFPSKGQDGSGVNSNLPSDYSNPLIQQNQRMVGMGNNINRNTEHLPQHHPQMPHPSTSNTSGMVPFSSHQYNSPQMPFIQQQNNPLIQNKEFGGGPQTNAVHPSNAAQTSGLNSSHSLPVGYPNSLGGQQFNASSLSNGDPNLSSLTPAQQASYLAQKQALLRQAKIPGNFTGLQQNINASNITESPEDIANKAKQMSSMPYMNNQSRVVAGNFQQVPAGINPQGLPQTAMPPHLQMRMAGVQYHPNMPHPQGFAPQQAVGIKRKIEDERDMATFSMVQKKRSEIISAGIDRERALRPEYHVAFSSIDDAIAKLGAYRLFYSNQPSDSSDESWREIFVQNAKQHEERFEKLKTIHSDIQKKLRDRPAKEELLLLEKLTAIAEKDGFNANNNMNNPHPQQQQFQYHQPQQIHNPMMQQQHQHHPTKSKGGTQFFGQ